MPVSAGSQPWPVTFWSLLRSVTSVPKITLRRYLPALRGYFTVSLTAFNICFPCNRPLAFVRFSGGCSDGDSPCTMRSLWRLLATSAAWLGSGWQLPCAWLHRRTFRSICAGRIARRWITFQKEGNKIPRKPLSVLLCSLWLVFFFFFIPFKMVIAVWKRGLPATMPGTIVLL